jgi:hypothetical protein
MDEFLLDFENKLNINNVEVIKKKLIKFKIKPDKKFKPIPEPIPKTNKSINSKGAKCSENGNKYEIQIWNILKYTTINNEIFNNQLELELGGSTSNNDIICNFNGKYKNISIEIKNTINAEFIQLDVHKENDKWLGPKITKKSHPLSVINRYLEEINLQKNLYYNILPPLNKTRKEFDDWQEWLINKKKEFKSDETKDYLWECKNTNFVKNNYKDKGCSYIQINKYGLYHLGEDICNFNVPEFKSENTILRLRCKRRGSKGCVPSSITMSAYISGLGKSQFSLDNINTLPKNLIYKI